MVGKSAYFVLIFSSFLLYSLKLLIFAKSLVFMESYRVIDQERMLGELDPMAHELGVECGELSFGAEVSEHAYDTIRMLFGWSEEFNAQGVAFNALLKTYNEMAEWMERFCSLARRGKRRKTTYKTIRRDCAKRNRHK